jgi:hypothetical protein
LRPDVAAAPLLLGRICKIWRDISIHTPTLWSCLEIRYLREVNQKSKDDTEMTTTLVPSIDTARQWLQRAKSTTLSIKFARTPSWIPLTGPPDPPGVLDVIFGAMKQWKNIYLTIPEMDERYLCKLLEKHGGEAPLLENFLIDTGASEEDLPDGPPEVLSRALWNIAATSTVLKSLSVLGVSSFINSSVVLNLNGYSQLSVIDLISQISAKEALSILHCAPNIEYCSLSCVSTPRATGLVERLILPRLKDLRLQGVLVDSAWCGSFESILANITAPTVSALYLVRVDEWPHKTLLSFIHRSQCNIQTLALLSAAVHTVPNSRDPEELIELLSVLPSLEYLWLDVQRITTRIGMTPREVNALGMWNKETKSFVYCPNLRVMAFSCKQVNTFTRGFLKALASVVSARWKRPGQGRTLRKFIMDRQNVRDHQRNQVTDTDKSIARIITLRDAGLVVEWDQPTEFDDVNGLQYDYTREAGKWRL